jgi:hypothetical protein
MVLGVFRAAKPWRRMTIVVVAIESVEAENRHLLVFGKKLWSYQQHPCAQIVGVPLRVLNRTGFTSWESIQKVRSYQNHRHTHIARVRLRVLKLRPCTSYSSA